MIFFSKNIATICVFFSARLPNDEEYEYEEYDENGGSKFFLLNNRTPD